MAGSAATSSDPSTPLSQCTCRQCDASHRFRDQHQPRTGGVVRHSPPVTLLVLRYAGTLHGIKRYRILVICRLGLNSGFVMLSGSDAIPYWTYERVTSSRSSTSGKSSSTIWHNARPSCTHLEHRICNSNCEHRVIGLRTGRSVRRAQCRDRQCQGCLYRQVQTHKRSW